MCFQIINKFERFLKIYNQYKNELYKIALLKEIANENYQK